MDIIPWLPVIFFLALAVYFWVLKRRGLNPWTRQWINRKEKKGV